MFGGAKTFRKLIVTFLYKRLSVYSHKKQKVKLVNYRNLLDKVPTDNDLLELFESFRQTNSKPNTKRIFEQITQVKYEENFWTNYTSSFLLSLTFNFLICLGLTVTKYLGGKYYLNFYVHIQLASCELKYRGGQHPF